MNSTIDYYKKVILKIKLDRLCSRSQGRGEDLEINRATFEAIYAKRNLKDVYFTQISVPK